MKCLLHLTRGDPHAHLYDPDKLADAALALLGAFEFDNGRAWKRHDFDVMARLLTEGCISDPRNRYESVHLTLRV